MQGTHVDTEPQTTTFTHSLQKVHNIDA